MKLHRTHAFAVCSFVALATASTGCSSGADHAKITPKVVVLGSSKQALTTGALTSINGRYGDGCTTDAGAFWSARVAGSEPMAHPELSVVQDNVECELTVYELVTDVTYYVYPTITLGTAYAASASRVYEPWYATYPFYANAKVDSLDFKTAFTISVVLSDDTRSADATIASGYASHAAVSNTGAIVAAPDYSIDSSTLSLKVDKSLAVVSATGGIGLGAGSNPGETYSVVESAGASFAEIDTAFMQTTPTALGASIAAADLFLEGVTLPASRTIIIAHEADGVRSYQVQTMTFNPPSGG